MKLLKTPTANLPNCRPQHPDKRKAGGHGPNLNDEAVFLFPTPTKSDGTGGPGRSPKRAGGDNLRTAVTEVPQDWGVYAPAIHRQERWHGRTAPAPSEVGPRGGIRLSARFAEWMMGLADGWVTGVLTKRDEQLIRIGNGVMPQQAEAAFTHILNNWPEISEENSHG